MRHSRRRSYRSVPLSKRQVDPEELARRDSSEYSGAISATASARQHRRRRVLRVRRRRCLGTHESIFVLGPTGVGKSYVACAPARKACRDGYSALYTRAPSLFRDLGTARADGELAKFVDTRSAAVIRCVRIGESRVHRMHHGELLACLWCPLF